MNPKEILEKELLGAFISRFSVGDTWEIYFGKYWLVAQNIISEDEEILNQWILKNYEYSKDTVDKENIAKSAIVAANMRKAVIGLKLDDRYNLTIEFENGSNLLIPTHEDIVDWQWCFNKSGGDPYQDYLVACFWEGEIEFKNH